MPPRIVKVQLVAEVAEYQKAMQEAAQKTRDAGTEAEKLAQKTQAFNQLGAAATAFGAAVVAGVGLAIDKFAEFDQQMSAVQAATHASAEDLGALRDAAMDAGARTAFSATEAAQGIEELSRAGVQTADILSGGLDAALDLAAAGGMEVAEAAGIAAVAMQTFGLSGADVTRVADNLAAGAGKAMGDVSDLGYALSQAGTVAASTGLSIEETTAGLAAFASAGILGSDAGTSFRSMLMRLTPQSAEARDAMAELGVSAFDAQGEFIGLEAFAGNLNTVFAQMDTESRNAALGVIFGSDAIRAANILIDEGETGIRDWISAVDDQGYAAETASMRLNNLRGDWEEFTGALDTALIGMGEGANGPLRGFVQGLTSLVNDFTELPDWAQQVTLGIGGITGALALGTGAFLLGVPKVAEYREAIKTMGTTAQTASRFIGALGRTAGVATGLFVLGSAANSAAEAMGMAGGKAKSLEETFAALRQNRFDLPFEELSTDVEDLSSAFDLLLGDSFNAQAERFGSQLNVFGWADQVRETRTQFETMGDALARMVNSGDAERAEVLFNEIATAAVAQGYSIEDVRDLMPSYTDALTGAANEADTAAAATEDTAAAVAELQGAAEDADGAVEDLAETIRGFGSATLDTRAAQREFEQAVDDLTASLEENGSTLDVNTEEGRANEAALDDLVTRTLELSAATYEQTGSQEAATEVIEAGRAKLVEAAEQLGMTKEEAEAYADSLGLIPENINTAVGIQGTDDAITKLQALKEWADSIPAVKTVTLETIQIGGPTPGGRVISADGSAELPNADGGIYKGGVPLYKFAEPETEWETFISGKPSQRERNIGLWMKTGDMLGVGDLLGGGGGQSIQYSPTIVQREGVSDRRIAQTAAEELAWKLK